MSDRKRGGVISEYQCCTCGKTFLVESAAQWAYKISYDKLSPSFCCSYRCLCEIKARKAEQKKATAKHGTTIDRDRELLRLRESGSDIQTIADTFGISYRAAACGIHRAKKERERKEAATCPE